MNSSIIPISWCLLLFSKLFRHNIHTRPTWDWPKHNLYIHVCLFHTIVLCILVDKLICTKYIHFTRSACTSCALRAKRIQHFILLKKFYYYIMYYSSTTVTTEHKLQKASYYDCLDTSSSMHTHKYVRAVVMRTVDHSGSITTCT